VAGAIHACAGGGGSRDRRHSTGVLRPVRLGLATVLLCLLAACAMPEPPDWMRVGDYADTRGQPARGAATASRAGSIPATVEVRRGDSVSLIAQRYGVSTQALIAANSLQPPYTLYPGQTLRMPVPATHVVKRGDTLSGIAQSRGVPIAALAARNRLQPPYRIYVGQELEMPSTPARAGAPVRPQGGPSAPATVPPAPAPAPGRTMTAERAAPAPQPRAAVSAPPPRSGRQFAWPLSGRILSSYGPKEGGLHNDGINIAAQPGDPVRAAENGVVVYAGNELAGFGNLLLLRHADNWVTAYAHNAELLVQRGDQVNRGQIIARAGRTGNVSTPQLHFEIRQGRQAVDPLQHLPQMTTMLTGRN